MCRCCLPDTTGPPAAAPKRAPGRQREFPPCTKHSTNIIPTIVAANAPTTKMVQAMLSSQTSVWKLRRRSRSHGLEPTTQGSADFDMTASEQLTRVHRWNRRRGLWDARWLRELGPRTSPQSTSADTGADTLAGACQQLGGCDGNTELPHLRCGKHRPENTRLRKFRNGLPRLRR